MKTASSSTDLVLNPDGSVYHLHLKVEHIANNVILVGDPRRVAQVSAQFDKIEFQVANREFVTHTGLYNNKRITVISSGIGTDNIDIVLNELYAALHFDPVTRVINEEKRSLNIVRIGTSGTLHAHIPIGSFLASSHGLGLDGLVYYYNYNFSDSENSLQTEVNQQLNWPNKLAIPYICKASPRLLAKIGLNMTSGITASGTGFYGPQGRKLGGFGKFDVEDKLRNVNVNGLRITNFDMETSALYGLGKLFGFDCCTVNAIIANRATQEYLEHHEDAINELIKLVLNRI